MSQKEIELISAKFAELSRLMAQQEAKNEAYRFIVFSRQELQKMGKRTRKQITIDGNKIPYDVRYNGCLRIRRQIQKRKIEVCGATAEALKRNYLARLEEVLAEINGADYEPPTQAKHKAPPPVVEEKTKMVIMRDYAKEWLAAKKAKLKPSSYNLYEIQQNRYIDPAFGDMPLNEITRAKVQEFVNGFIENGRIQTITRVLLQIKCIFDMAAADFGIQNPTKKIELPYHEVEHAEPLTIDDERFLVEQCKKEKNRAVASALLVLLYFGLRKSELKTIRIDGEFLFYTPSKGRQGRKVNEIEIPFTPVFKRVLPYVDFEQAKNCNTQTLAIITTRIFKNRKHHHPHDLRSTAISRWKECGVNFEVVMLWDSHKTDKDVSSSRVDRGYTKYSREYLIKEAQKVDYKL